MSSASTGPLSMTYPLVIALSILLISRRTIAKLYLTRRLPLKKAPFKSLVYACCRRASAPTQAVSTQPFAVKSKAVKREGPRRTPIAPTCDDTAFANDVDIQIHGFNLPLNDVNKKRVRELIVARGGRNEFDSPNANRERIKRSVPQPPTPSKDLRDVRINRRPTDHPHPDTETIREHYSILPSFRRPFPPGINFIPSDDVCEVAPSAHIVAGRRNRAIACNCSALGWHTSGVRHI